jgi:CHAT domain
VNEVIVHIDPFQGGGTVCYVESPYPIPSLVSLVPLADLTNLAPPNLVRQVGEGLAERIRGNDSVKQVLDVVLAHPAAPPSLPIQFLVADPDAHALSWESLVANNDFVALNDRWPIARIARGATLQSNPVRPFATPVRVMAVLSAVQREAKGEWEALYAAVVKARAEGLPVEVTLVAAEESSVLDPARALGDPDLEVLPVPNPAAETPLLELVTAKQPHLLHLLCHGTVRDDVRLLEVGTIGDFDRNDGKSTVVIRAEELGLAASRGGTWCVLLNACRGAEAGNESLTHAEEVVAQGVPAAVGMRRQVDVDDAKAFTREWYPRVFGALGALAGSGEGSHPFIWSDMLCAARRRLRDLHGGNPGDDDTWTVPVLYKLPGPFSLVIPQAGVGEEQERSGLSEADVLDGLMAIMPADADQAVVADLQGLTQ